MRFVPFGPLSTVPPVYLYLLNLVKEKAKACTKKYEVPQEANIQVSW